MTSTTDESISVSVLMLTYNHAPFIEMAVRSVLSQKRSFLIEILIGDDCSTDDTLSIAFRLQQEAPELIRVLPTQTNLGITPNFLRLVDACKGKYIAMLEGDDYWIEDNKIQYQFEMMEKDSSLSLCAGKTRNRLFWSTTRPYYSLPDLLRRYLFHTSTLFFRRQDVPNFEGYERVLALDSLLIAFLLEKGNCGFIDQELSYYRRHDGGAWTGRRREKQIEASQQLTDALSAYFGGRFCKELSDRELWIYSMVFQAYPKSFVFSQWMSDLSRMRHVISRNFRHQPYQCVKIILLVAGQPIVVSFVNLRGNLKIGTRLRSLTHRK